MIKGINKSIIVVDPPQKSSFEKIFFIVKAKRSASGSDDMLTEANRLIRDSLETKDKRSAVSKRKAVCIFLVGAVVGAAVTAIMLLLLGF